MSPCRSQSGNNGDAGAGAAGIMLFGVRVTVDPMRKSVSMNNLSQYQQPNETPNADVAAGYVSDDVVHKSTGNRERKRGATQISFDPILSLVVVVLCVELF